MPFPLDGKIDALYEMKRGFRLIFQAGGPAFLRSAALFPVVKCVEVYACQIDSFDESPKRPKIKPSKYMGVVRPFSGTLRLAGRGVFALPPPHTLPPKYFTSWERTR